MKLQHQNKVLETHEEIMAETEKRNRTFLSRLQSAMNDRCPWRFYSDVRGGDTGLVRNTRTLFAPPRTGPQNPNTATKIHDIKYNKTAAGFFCQIPKKGSETLCVLHKSITNR